MKMNTADLLFNELTVADECLTAEVMSLLKCHCNHVSPYNFIYREDNYKNLSQSFFMSKSDKVFYALNPENRLSGIARFKGYNTSILLEHLITNNRNQSLQIEMFLVLNSLKKIYEENSKLRLFEVDVFEKDKRLFKLFLTMGMEIADYCYYYDITNYCTDYRVNSLLSAFNTFSFIASPFGYKELYDNDIHIGTLINDSHLLVKAKMNVILLKKLNLFFNQRSLKSVWLVSKKALELLLIDKSFHLTIPFKKLQLFENIH